MGTLTPVNPNASADTPLPQTRGRRLSDQVLAVFNQACDTRDLLVAEHLFHLLELMAAAGRTFGTPDRRLNLQHLVDAHERLVALRSLSC